MPQQNGVSGRRNWTFLDIVRSMMSYSDLLKFLWGYTPKMMTYILNSVPTMSILNTPVELWTGRNTSIQHYKIWGFLEYFLKGKTKKLNTKSKLCYFIEYPKGIKG